MHTTPQTTPYSLMHAGVAGGECPFPRRSIIYVNSLRPVYLSNSITSP